MRTIAQNISPIIRKYIMIALLALVASPVLAQTGPWYLNANGAKLTLEIAEQRGRRIAYLSSGSACNEKLDSPTFDSESGLLEFRRRLPGSAQWYRVTIADGVMVGRFASAIGSNKPPLSAYKYHVTGWNRDAFPDTPAVFDILVAEHSRARLRIDRQTDGRLIGRLKFYAMGNSAWEYPEEEIGVQEWDGETLTFRRGNQTYTGTVDGNTISGLFYCGGAVGYPWRGTRAEVLTYGIAPKTLEERNAWQERTRRTLYRLMMAGNPTPLSMNVEVLREGLPPIRSEPWPNRDDSPAPPQDYTLTELRLTFTLPNWLGGEPIRRVVHAYLAKPTTPPPAGLERYPLLLAVNGHSGSGYAMLDPGAHGWYGDAFARRGYMVLAVDIGHRPMSDVVRFGSQSDPANFLGYPGPGRADDEANGNGFHPSIKPTDDPYYTDWEEDGERAWDAMRALDYALSRSDVDPQRIATTGLSMGGEMASYLGALDPRIGVSIPAGFSPDLNVMKFLGSHGCWNWAYADIREYIDQSDLYALTAPRPLIVQTGKQDIGFSKFPQWQAFPGIAVNSAPFASDKQVMRRARIADGPVVHFLHPRAHEWQTGVASSGLTYPLIIEPRSPDDLLWQVDSSTATDGRDLFQYVRQYLNF